MSFEKTDTIQESGHLGEHEGHKLKKGLIRKDHEETKSCQPS